MKFAKYLPSEGWQPVVYTPENPEQLAVDILCLLNIKKRGSTTMTVTKETLIGDILDHDVQTAQFFFEIGMHCLGCPHSRGESIEDACLVHGTDADALVKKINDFLAGK